MSLGLIPRLVAKELADNAIDASGSCRTGLLEDGGFFVEDDGKGIDGDDKAVANLFSIRRPYTSSKLFRLPTRGALGNGLRVVVGAVLASGGTLTVKTRGRSLTLQPQNDGTTSVALPVPWEGNGTRVEVRLGCKLEVDPDDVFEWARYAERLAGKGKEYGNGSRKRRTSSPAFSSRFTARNESFVRALRKKPTALSVSNTPAGGGANGPLTSSNGPSKPSRMRSNCTAI